MAKQWSDEQILLSQTMWGYGFSEKAIAKELGGEFTLEAINKKINAENGSGEKRITDEPWISIEEIYAEIKPKLKAKKAKQNLPVKKKLSNPTATAKSKSTPKKNKATAKDSKASTKPESPAQSNTKPKSKSQPGSKVKAKHPPKSVSQDQSKVKNKTAPSTQPDKGPKVETKPLKKPPISLDKESRKRISIMELTEATCRWPFGDPQEVDFYFCGNTIEAGEVYCLEHCIEAYQNYATRKEEREKAAQQENQAQAYARK